VFASFYGYLIFFVFESIFRMHYPQREKWKIREDMFHLFQAKSAIFFLGCIHLRYLDILPTSLFCFIPFLLTTINYSIMSKAPLAAKHRRLLNLCFFSVQALLISLKVEGWMPFGWKAAFIPFWIYFIAVLCHYLVIISKFLSGISTVSQHDSQNEMDVLTQFLGLCWSFVYYGLNFVALLGVSGFARAYNNPANHNFCLLKTAAFTGLFFSSLLILFTTFGFSQIAKYLKLSNIPRNVSIELQVPERSQPQRIEMEVEEREDYFVMRSWTYFLPLKNNLLKNAERLKKIKDIIHGLKFGKGCSKFCKKKEYERDADMKMLRKSKDIQDRKFKSINHKNMNENWKSLSKAKLAEQFSVSHIENNKEIDKWEGDMSIEANKHKRNRYFSLTDIDDIKNLGGDPSSKVISEEEKHCYLCCERPPNAVLLNCGHGGICYDCAVNLMKTKNKCMECRGVVDGIYKVDPNPKLFDIIKGKELTKIIKL